MSGPLELNNSSSFTLVDSEVSVFNEMFFGGSIETIGGSLSSEKGIEFQETAILSIDGTTVSADEGIDFFGSFESISDATFSNSAAGGTLRINGQNSVVQMTDTMITVGLESAGFGDLESMDASDAGTLVIKGNSEITLDELQDGARLELLDCSMAFVKSDISGVGNSGSTVTLFSTTGILVFSSANLGPNIDRRNFVINGLTGMTYNDDPSAWNIADWDGLSNVALQLKGDFFLGDVNLDGDLNLLDLAPFLNFAYERTVPGRSRYQSRWRSRSAGY